MRGRMRKGAQRNWKRGTDMISQYFHDFLLPFIPWCSCCVPSLWFSFVFPHKTFVFILHLLQELSLLLFKHTTSRSLGNIERDRVRRGWMSQGQEQEIQYIFAWVLTLFHLKSRNPSGFKLEMNRRNNLGN